MDVTFRSAREGDLAAIVVLLAEDSMGAGRERVGDSLDPAYLSAWARVEADPNIEIVVAERGGEVVGCLQLTITPGLSRCGTTRATLEGIRVRRDQRGLGVGRRLLDFALDLARSRGCSFAQLTSDRAREGAHDFYAALGFEATHVGYKKHLAPLT